MSKNKILIYSIVFIFVIGLWTTLPKKLVLLTPKTIFHSRRLYSEEIVKTERDPFRYQIKVKQPYKKVQKQSLITLKGIIWDEENPSAVIKINEGKTRFVSEGDKIGEIKILKIEKDRIIIDERGRHEIKVK